MGASSKTPRTIPDSALTILHSIAAQWGDEVEDPKALQVIQLKGAMTNEVYQIKWAKKPNSCNTNTSHKKVLVRIYGEGVEVFFDREDEITTFEFLSRYGQGPRLLGRFENGRVEEFIRARTLSAADLHDPDVSTRIAIKLKEFNDLAMPGSKNVMLWDRLRNWLSTARRLSPPEEARAFRLDDLDQEILELEKKISGDQQVVGFCHNDLQYGNIMMDENTRSITIIDYEYASYNPVAYDIANHFCEMTADYHRDTPHILDFSKYPGPEERKRFLRAYLSSSGHQPSDFEVEQLDLDIQKYTLVSHLIWGLWGIISDHVNEIDFDYLEYARQRFQQYWLVQLQILGSTEPSTCSIADLETRGRS